MEEHLIEFSLEAYNFSCKQKEGETLAEFAIRAQKELDKKNIPVQITT